MILNYHNGRSALSGLRAVLSCHPWGLLGRHQQLVCDHVPCGKPAPVGMTREKHQNAVLTKSEPSQDRFGSYPMFVLGSIQRNDGLLEVDRQGRIHLRQLPEAADSQKVYIWETGRYYVLEKSRRGHLSWPCCWAPLPGSMA